MMKTISQQLCISLLITLCFNMAVQAQTDDAAVTDETEAAEESTEQTETTAEPRHHSIRYSCRLGELERRVEIDFPAAPTLLPCEVNYYKDIEAPGEKITLWIAENTEGYCESQGAGLVDKLRDQGWDCQAQ